MKKIDGLSMDIEKNEREKLRSIFPECFTEGKLDIDKLLNMCGEYITDDFERYEFKWKGKSECLQLAQQRSTGTLRPCPEESVNFDTTQNLYIEGDNLEVLKLLQTSYYRSVKMIYIDPPYNTGNDFVYEDDFADPLARYKEVTQQTTKSNPESMGRFHTNWLNMMYPRLRLAANLLRDDGVIFISIDDNEVHNLRKVCDEVFGEENFIATIVWQKKFAPQNDDKYLSDSHDYVLMYARNKENVSNLRIPRGESANQRFSNPDNDPRGPWASTDLTRQEHRDNSVYQIVSPSGKTWTPTSGTSWRHPQKEMEELIASGQIWFGQDGNSKPRRKKYLADLGDGVVVGSFWPHAESGHNQEGTQIFKSLISSSEVEFSNPKPVRLIKRLLQMASKDAGDIIFDFFSGSGTTAQAVMELSAEDNVARQFILVQLPELLNEKSRATNEHYKNICEIGKERIRRAGAKLSEGQPEAKKSQKQNGQLSLMDATPDADTPEAAPLDTGFKVFKLDTSNVKMWDSTPVADENLLTLSSRMNSMIDRIKSERSDMDVVYEVMLKLGVPLTYSVTQIDISGKAAYSVGDNCLLLICLAPGITPEIIEQVAEYAPAKIILAEHGFANDTAMSNAHYILQDRNIELDLV